MIHYIINCYSLDMRFLELCKDVHFDDDLEAIKFAYLLRSDFFNIYVLRERDNGQFIRVAKLY